MTHDLTGEHLRRHPVYQPPMLPDVEPIEHDDEPRPIELAPWLGLCGWALACVLFGVLIAKMIPG